jgi:hypothetical protein
VDHTADVDRAILR